MRFASIRSRVVIIGLILLAVLVALGISSQNGTKPAQPSSPPGNKTQASLVAAIRGVSVVLRNDDHFDWTNTKITLQHGGRLYSYQAGTIGKGETRGFLMSNFVSPEGEIFNYRKYKPEVVSIFAAEAEGTASVTR